jgi:YbgC/YbaW family acyl-CoA thioester hydrolase
VGGFVHTLRVRYAETDQQAVVFFGNWLHYFDDAMTGFVGWLGFPPVETFERHFDVMVVKAVVEWQGSARFDDDVDIAVVPTRLGNASFDVRFEASVGERPVCQATITYVSVTPGGSGRSCPIPPAIREKLEAAADLGQA